MNLRKRGNPIFFRLITLLIVSSLAFPNPAGVYPELSRGTLRARGADAGPIQAGLEEALLSHRETPAPTPPFLTAGLEEQTFPPEAVRIAVVENIPLMGENLVDFVWDAIANSDHPLARKISRDQIRLFDRGKPAVEWIEEQKPQLVITDDNLLDGRWGARIVQAARLANPGVAVVWESLSAAPRELQVTADLGNWEPDDLKKLVQEHILSRLSVSPSTPTPPAAGVEETGPGIFGKIYGTVEMLQHGRHPGDRMWAAEQLGRRGGPEAVSALGKALVEDKSAGVRFVAAKALGEMGPAAAPAVPQLRAALVRDSGHQGGAPRSPQGDDDVRSAAARALGRIGPGAAEALPDLKEALRVDYHFLRSAAERAIREISSPAGLEEAGILGSEGRVVRMRLERVFGSLEAVRRFGRAVREAASVHGQQVAVLLHPELVPGRDLLEKALKLIEIEGSLPLAGREGGWLRLELLSDQRSRQLKAGGYRVIHVVPHEGRGGVLLRQGILLVAAQAGLAAMQVSAEEGARRPFAVFLVDVPWYNQRVGDLRYSTFAVGLEELFSAA